MKLPKAKSPAITLCKTTRKKGTTLMTRRKKSLTSIFLRNCKKCKLLLAKVEILHRIRRESSRTRWKRTTKKLSLKVK